CVSWACTSPTCISCVCLIGVYFMGMYLTGVHFTGVYLMGVFQLAMRSTAVRGYRGWRRVDRGLARSPKPALPELCPRPISRPIVSPDTSRRLTVLFGSLGSIGLRLGGFLGSAFAPGEKPAFAVLAEVQAGN